MSALRHDEVLRTSPVVDLIRQAWPTINADELYQLLQQECGLGAHPALIVCKQLLDSDPAILTVPVPLLRALHKAGQSTGGLPERYDEWRLTYDDPSGLQAIVGHGVVVTNAMLKVMSNAEFARLRRMVEARARR